MKLLRFDYQQRYLAWDFETPTLGISIGDAPIQAPYQLGWCLHQGSKLIGTYEDWIWWDDLIQKMNKWGAKARAINKFNEAEYKDKATDATEILDRFEKHLLNPAVISITANGTNLDGYVYNIWRSLLGRPVNNDWHPNHVDVQCIYKAHILGIPFPKVGTDEWVAFNLKMSDVIRKGLKPNVANLCNHYGVPYDANQHHVSGAYDAEITFLIFQEQIKRYSIGR